MTSRISRELVAAAGFALAFAALTLWVELRGPFPGDERALLWAQQHPPGSEELSNFQTLFSNLGTPLVAVLTMTLAFAVVLRNVGTRSALAVAIAAAGAALEAPISDLVGATKASAQLGVLPGGHPSGHATYAAAGLGSLAWLGARHGRREVVGIVALVVLLMGVVRVTDRSHLLSEVLAGYCLGAAWLCVVVSVAGRR